MLIKVKLGNFTFDSQWKGVTFVRFVDSRDAWH